MKVTLKDIGVFKQAEYELGELTIICGKNNTGKTYATYSLYGFLDYWKIGYQIELEDKIIDNLFQYGTHSIILSSYKEKLGKEIEKSCKKFKSFLPYVFASNAKRFENSEFELRISDKEIIQKDEYSKAIKFTPDDILQITKESNQDTLSISFASKSDEIKNSSTKEIIKDEISDALKFIFFSETFPNVFIGSAERTGISMFVEDIKKNLHNRLWNKIANSPRMSISDIVDEFYSSPYPLPVSRDIQFNTDLIKVSKYESYISKEYPEIISDFSNLLGGEYKVDNKGELNFYPKRQKGIKLNMGESSSSVRSLLDVGFYLKHLAKKGDMLMIDEPELNLHPENQRKLAKLFARLVNIGIKVFITTHSDYIIKELNTLIMLNNKKEIEAIKGIMNKSNYSDSELIDPSKIKVYIACEESMKIDGKRNKVKMPTLKPAEIDDFYGIEAPSFDDSIDEMNRIQKSIVFER